MCGLDPTKYKGHSFRIDTAMFAQNVVFLMPKVGLWVGGYPTPFISIFGVQVCAQPLRLLGRLGIDHGCQKAFLLANASSVYA